VRARERYINCSAWTQEEKKDILSAGRGSTQPSAAAGADHACAWLIYNIEYNHVSCGMACNAHR